MAQVEISQYFTGWIFKWFVVKRVPIWMHSICKELTGVFICIYMDYSQQLRQKIIKRLEVGYKKIAVHVYNSVAIFETILKNILTGIYFCAWKKSSTPASRKIKACLQRTHLFRCVYIFLRILLDRKAAHHISLQGTKKITIDLTFSRLICLNKLDYHHVSGLW